MIEKNAFKQHFRKTFYLLGLPKAASTIIFRGVMEKKRLIKLGSKYCARIQPRDSN